MKKPFRHISRLLAAVLCAALCVPAAGCAAGGEDGGAARPWTDSLRKGEELPASESFEPVAEAGDYTLSVRSATGELLVGNTVTGARYYSNPPAAEEDAAATGYNKLSLASQLFITTISTDRVVDETNSKLSCVNKGGLRIFRIPGGVLCEYTMVNEKITIPVAYTVTEEGFEASILTESITEEGELKLISVSLLPYFGAVEPDKEGYLLIPDGCGALLELTAGQDNFAGVTYDGDVYGRDITYSTKKQTTVRQDILIPAFGLKAGERAVLGIITEGAACSSLRITAEGNQSSYSSIYPTLAYRRTDNMYLREEKFDEKQLLIYNKKAVSFPRYTVRYSFLEGEEADYTGMARKTADYYAADDKTAAGIRAGLWVETIGSVKKPDNVLGIPVETVTPVTDFSEAAALLSALSDGGLPVNLLYQGIYKGGLYDLMPVKAVPEGKLGGKAGFKELLAAARGLSATVYPAADLLSIYRSGEGVSYRMDAVRDANGGFKEIYAFQPSTQTKDKEGLIRTILKAGKLGGVYESHLEGLAALGGTAMADTGLQFLTADYHRGGRETDRQQAMDCQTVAAKAAAAQLGAYLVEKAGAYLFESATAISAVPLQSSRMNGISAEVPFYQLVAGRFAQLVSSPCNLSADTETAVLKAVEYGVMPSILLLCEDPLVLSDTAANWAFTGEYAAALPQAKALMETVRRAFGPVEGAQFVAHSRPAEGVAVSEYSNGVRIAVNYTDAPVRLEDAEIPSMGFAVLP